MKSVNSELLEIFEAHKKVVLAFSGGKDSQTLLHLCKAFKEYITVVWADTGYHYPHMPEFVHQSVDGFTFVELKTNQQRLFREKGFPTDAIDAFSGIARTDDSGERSAVPMRNSWILCCAELKGRPVVQYAQLTGATAILYGQKYVDHAPLHEGTYFGGATDFPIEFIWPLRHWTDQEVLDYAHENKIDLPFQYPEHDSLECWNCTASRNVRKMPFLKKHYSLLAEQLEQTLKGLE